MDTLEELKYVDLARFDRGYLLPSANEHGRLFQQRKSATSQTTAQYAVSDPATGLERYYLADILEGYLWLELGVSLNVFPTDGARRLARQRFALVFLELPAFLESWGYIFPQYTKDLIQTAINQREFFLDVGLMNFADPYTLHSSFQSAWLMESAFSRDPDARAFVTALNFHYEDLQRAIGSSRAVESNLAFSYIEGLINVGTGSIPRGLLKALDHLAKFGFFFEHLAQNSSIQEHDSGLFQAHIKQLGGWRVDRGQRRASYVFQSFVESLDRHVPLEIERYIDRFAIDVNIRSLLSVWREGASMLSAS